MQDQNKTTQQLIDELDKIRLRVAELETVQKSLNEKGSRYRQIVDNISEAVFVIQDGWIKFANDKTSEITGYSREDASSFAAITTFVHPDDREMVAQYHASRLRGAETHYRYAFRVVRKDGNVRWTEMNSSSIIWKGRPASLCLMADITERKQAEVETSRLAYIVESSDDAIIGKTLNGDIVSWNRGAERLYGYKANEVVGQPISILVPPEQFDDLPNILTRIRRGEDVRHFETKRRTKDGRIVEVSLSISAIKDTEGCILGACSIARDITEAKLLEEERLGMQRKLLRSERLESLQVMAGGIAHVFNNQLAVVQSNLELCLTDQTLDSETRYSINMALKSAKRLAELTHQILIYTGNAFNVSVDVDINKLVKRNVALLKLRIPKTTTLHLKIHKNLPFIRGDVDQIELVIMHLVNNASEAIGDTAGDVTIRTGVMDCDEEYLSGSRIEEKPAPGRFVFLEVTDNGSGMDIETQHKLFDPFFTTKFAGRGLGMAAVIGIVKVHHGAIMVDSEVGKGATIRVLFSAAVSA